jgi:hypothetical protein
MAFKGLKVDPGSSSWNGLRMNGLSGIDSPPTPQLGLMASPIGIGP